jgi:hypothetical protein
MFFGFFFRDPHLGSDFPLGGPHPYFYPSTPHPFSLHPFFPHHHQSPTFLFPQPGVGQFFPQDFWGQDRGQHHLLPGWPMLNWPQHFQPENVRTNLAEFEEEETD